MRNEIIIRGGKISKCHICDLEDDDEYIIFEKIDGRYICKNCIETKYKLKDLFKGLIIE
ncbi:MAG: hypothetical protein JSW06_00585 [Thermoplasmatales archaeon]|nr:MAG: hypothetical protein JSW06_00585 [Thermoplasmatales archaeon]